uniref:PhnA-like protein n=1 Tax=Oscillatoriales cyanobacterium SpSt-402 TaxID=2282168 RepID=A0A832M5Y4_9CYAN
MVYGEEPRGRVVERVSSVPAIDYHDRVRWGPVLAGLFVAIASQLVLSGIAAAIGLTTIAGSGAPRSDAGDVGAAVGIGAIISLLISLFLGGWITSRACGPINRSTALLNGAILWATTLAISGWLLSSGVSGAFGIVASNAGEVINQAQQGGVNPANVDPNITAQQTRDIAGNAAKIGWSFALGSLLGLIAALIGATVGNKTSRTDVPRTVDPTYTP